MGHSELRDEALTMKVSLAPEVHDLIHLDAPAELRELVIPYAPGLQSLDGIERFSKLKVLSLRVAPALVSVSALSRLEGLASLGFGFVRQLRNLRALSHARALRELGLLSCGVEDLGIVEAPCLEKLFLQEVPALQDLRGLGRAPALREVMILDAPGLESLDGLEHSKLLLFLKVRNASRLRSIDALRPRRLSACVLETTSVADIGRLRGALGLGWLSLDTCSGLRSLEPLRGHKRLHSVDLHGLEIDSLEPLSQSPKLKHVNHERVAEWDASIFRRADVLEKIKRPLAVPRAQVRSLDSEAIDAILQALVAGVATLTLQDRDAVHDRSLYAGTNGFFETSFGCWGDFYSAGPFLRSEVSELLACEPDLDAQIAAIVSGPRGLGRLEVTV